MTAVLDMIALQDLTLTKLEEVYRSAFIPSEITEDGTVKLELEGIKTFVKVEPEKKILRFFALFGTKPGTTRNQVLELSNRINDELVLIRACCPSALPTPALWLDHDLDTESGMTAEDIVTETRRFRQVISAMPPKDTESILS
jgi:hypothetical protein